MQYKYTSQQAFFIIFLYVFYNLFTFHLVDLGEFLICKVDPHTRLAAIDGDDGYTGVKPQHRYVTCSPWHHPSTSFRIFFYFYSNKKKTFS